ncbi:MAG TPA: Ig-like domain-containing protein [Ignavibacteria bacterium]|nr:Ig-like domain-containing protein [Ignavibacteria bacterium]HMR41777.1 Ig-like domain-containing protein [Ignavibacteria bacterium]
MKLLKSLTILSLIILSSCANQLPPGGGDIDRTPPEIRSITPRPGAVNFKGRSVRIVFNEYVDRRSFEESFFISPKPKGNPDFSWSGKEVEIVFSKALDINRTYVIYIGKDLKDVNGGNTLSAPLTFAFSTGSRIDEGIISGNVFADNYDRVKVTLYLKAGKTADQLDPQKNDPDYVLQVTPGGNFDFTNLPDGDYRIFAITDEDRNNRYDPDLDKIALLSDDYKLSGKQNVLKNLNLVLQDFGLDKLDKSSIEFRKLLKPDSLNFIFSNISEGEKKITPDYKMYFYFDDNISKQNIVNNFSVSDTATGEPNKVVFNWLSDSLLEVFPIDKYKLSSAYNLKIDLRQSDRNYIYSRNFETASANEFAALSGRVMSDSAIGSDVYIKLYNKENPFITYSQKVNFANDSTDFKFEKVLEGKYILFSFMDDNSNGVFDRGNYYPFRASESFIIYENEINIKGGWNLDNVFLKY